MKKTISITLAGRVFTIEDDAFAVLEEYLGGLKAHFSKDESAEELMADIESSIAEKFSEKLGPGKEAVTIDDVRDVISVMGRLEEIADEEESTESTTSTEPKKDTKDEDDAPKRLYRDSEDVVIAGVCSGLAAYFGISVIFVRIAFLLLVLVNGIGILLYLILWAAVPQAKTNAQKFEMRGKRLNVDEIEQVVKEKAKMMGEEGKAAYERVKANDGLFSRILNIPVAIVGAVFRGLRALFLALGPILSVTVGIALMIGAIVGIAATSIGASMFFFPTHSEYLVSDLPIAELASQPLYYIGVAAAYLFVLVPLTLLTMLATTLIQRKNAFRVLPVAGLIGLWILSASAGAVAAREIGPWAYNRVQEIERESTATRTYDVKDFEQIMTSGHISVRVTRGETFGMTVTGMSQAIDRLSVTTTNGMLSITTNDRDRGPCFFCVVRKLDAEITLPELTSYTAKDVTRASIMGFENDLTLNAQDASRIDVTLDGQNVTSTIRDIGRIFVTGESKLFVASLSDASHLDAEDLIAESIRITQSDVSRVSLQGNAQDITANLKDVARLNGKDLDVEEAHVTTRDMSRADVTPKNALFPEENVTSTQAE